MNLDLARSLDLTPAEYRMLERLCIANGAFVTLDVLHQVVSKGKKTDPKIVTVYACKLRKKLASRGLKIESYWGGGYRLAAAKRASLDATVALFVSGHSSNHQQAQGG